MTSPFFNIEKFIAEQITGRQESLFANDIKNNAAQLSEKVKGKSVLVIGGAGTIGASFIKAILPFRPASLYVVDINENGLTELTRDLRSTANLVVPEIYKTYPINFGDQVFTKIIRQQGPFDIVANFAAHKHVRSEKDHYSIEAMIKNNVIKAKQLLDLLLEFPPEHFFCVSTDKAANPVNVMGASKKLMEEVILSYAERIPITTARFANVAFSNGSLLFGFLERMFKRQPLSSPSDVRRYFVSPQESGQLCMLACLLGNSGDIFFPKLDPDKMLSFSEIADLFLAEFGLQPELCSTETEAKEKAAQLKSGVVKYPVYYFKTNTSGEKPYEEFYTRDEEVDMHLFEALGVIKNAKSSIKDVEENFRKLEDLFNQEMVNKKEIVNLLEEFIPTFEHIEKGKNLDQKM